MKETITEYCITFSLHFFKKNFHPLANLLSCTHSSKSLKSATVRYYPFTTTTMPSNTILACPFVKHH